MAKMQKIIYRKKAIQLRKKIKNKEKIVYLVAAMSMDVDDDDDERFDEINE